MIVVQCRHLDTYFYLFRNRIDSVVRRVMDFQFVYQPEHHFRFFDLCDEPKKTIQSINDYEQIPLVTLEDAIEPLVQFVSQVREMIKLVKDKCLQQQAKDNLSLDESASIMLYTMEWIPKEDSFYFIFNRKLSSNDDDDLKPWYSYLKLLSTSLTKLPRLSHRIFYRAIQSDLKTQYSINKNFFWYGYSSWNSSLEFYNQDKYCFDQTKNRTLFIIHSEHGIDISKHSFYSIKQEILLPPGQKFQVVSCRVSTNGLCVVILKEISSELESISPTTIDSKELKAFKFLFRKRVKKYEKYSEINLRNQNLTDSHMDIIVKYAIQKKQCHWLSLQNNQITSYGLSILANGLEKNQSLQSLYLSQNFVKDLGVECLTKILVKRYSNLTFLSLNYNRITDRGAQYLANMLKSNDILTDLWLSYNEIGNAGVQSLADVLLSKNETLTQLYLNGNTSINNLIIDDLVLMLKLNRRLNTLWLQDCNLTKEGKEILENSIESREDFDLYI